MVSLVAVLILAGGHSTRMGQDKALLSLGGQSLLQRTCEIALECSPATFVITPWPQRYRAVIPDTVEIFQETQLTNISQQDSQRSPGPLIGFAQGLQQLNQRHIAADWVLLLACDLPYLQGAVLQQWQSQLAVVPAHAIAALPHSPKGWEPLCGFYRRTVLASLEVALEQGIRSFQRWLVAATIAPLSAPSSMLVNCNTPQQWQQVLQASKKSVETG